MPDYDYQFNLKVMTDFSLLIIKVVIGFEG